MISHIYARNLGPVPKGKKTRYEYEYYQTGEGPRLITGFVDHDRKDRAMSLLSAIVDDAQVKQLEAEQAS